MNESYINLHTVTSKVLCFEALLLCGILLLSAIIVVYIAFPVTLLKLYDRSIVFLCGIRRKRLQIGGDVFSYCESGYRSTTRTTYVMLHGVTGTNKVWVPVISRLPRGAHCVSVNLPGHGGTHPIDDVTMEGQADQIHKLVEALGLRDFHLLGLSMGGLLAGVYTARYPEHVKLLTLIAPTMKTPELTHFQEELREGRSCLIAETVAELRHMMSVMAHFPIFSPTQGLKGLLKVQKPRQTYFRKLINELGSERGEKLLETLAPSLRQPTHLIWGEYDQAIHLSGADFLKHKLRNCRRVDIIQNCGHVPMFDNPRNMTKVIGLFRQENNVLL